LNILIDFSSSPVINESLENKTSELKAVAVFVVVNIKKLFKISQTIIDLTEDTLIKYLF